MQHALRNTQHSFRSAILHLQPETLDSGTECVYRTQRVTLCSVPVATHHSFAMIWLYRLQQRLSITRHEGLAVLTLASLFLLGLTVRHVQEQQTPPVASDSLVAQSTADSASARASEPDFAPPSAEDPINVNSASLNALQALPGIGPALSKRIEAYRSSQRSFQHVDELTRVSGIGPKTLETLRPMVRVDAPADAAEPDANPES